MEVSKPEYIEETLLRFISVEKKKLRKRLLTMSVDVGLGSMLQNNESCGISLLGGLNEQKRIDRGRYSDNATGYE